MKRKILKLLITSVLMVVTVCPTLTVYAEDGTQATSEVVAEVPSRIDEAIVAQNAMVPIQTFDPFYQGVPYSATGEERATLEALVQGESGGTSVFAAALVAQCIRDAYVYKGYPDINTLRRDMKYSGSVQVEPNQNTKEAVRLIFDEGKNAVQKNIMYFYAPAVVHSGWHETQEFVIEAGGHRFFAEKQS